MQVSGALEQAPFLGRAAMLSSSATLFQSAGDDAAAIDAMLASHRPIESFRSVLAKVDVLRGGPIPKFTASGAVVSILEFGC